MVQINSMRDANAERYAVLLIFGTLVQMLIQIKGVQHGIKTKQRIILQRSMSTIR